MFKKYVLFVGFCIAASLAGSCNTKPRPWHLGNFRDTPVWDLAQAVGSQDTAAIRRLVCDQGMDPDYQEPIFRMTLLGFSIYYLLPLSAKALLDCGGRP